MARFDHLIDQQNAEERALRNARNRETAKLLRSKDRDVETIEKAYRERLEGLTKSLEDRQNSLRAEYTRKSAAVVLDELERDCATLEERSRIPVSSEKIEKAQRFLEAIQGIPQDNIEKLIPVFLNGDSELKQAIEDIQQGRLSSPYSVIHSYICTDHEKNQCLLLIPVKTQLDNKLLPKKLEDKVVKIVSLKELVTGASQSPNGAKGDSTARITVSKVNYIEGQEEVQGFNSYSMQLNGNSSKDELDRFARALGEKLKILAPEEFAGARITYEIQEIDPAIINYLRANPRERIITRSDLLNRTQAAEFSIAETAQIIGTSEHVIKRFCTQGRLETTENGNVKRESIESYNIPGQRRQPIQRTNECTTWAYSSTGPSGIKEEALARLDSFEEARLNSKQVAYILGVAQVSLSTMVNRNPSDHSLHAVEKRGNKGNYFTKGELIRFLATHKRIGIGGKRQSWREIDE